MMPGGGDPTAGEEIMAATLRNALALALFGASGLAAAGGAAGAEASGCDQFKWPIAHEQTALAAPGAGPLSPGATLPADAGARLKLVLLSEAKLAMPPERPPKFSPSYAGAFVLDAPAAAGVYKVTVSAGGWIDVIQEGKFLRPVNLSVATGCANARKSVKFRFAAGPATVQLTGVGQPDIAVIVSPE